MIWRIIDLALLGVIIALLERNRRTIMAFGQETQAALAELDTAISTELDEFAAFVIERTGADGELAAAIRERANAVKGIVPNTVDAGEVVTPDAPADEPVATPDPVDPAPADPATEAPTAPATPADDPSEEPADIPLLSGDDVDDEGDGDAATSA